MSLENHDSIMIQTRGRWSATKSVLRYKQHGRYLRVKESLTAGELSRVPEALNLVKNSLGKFFPAHLVNSSASGRRRGSRTTSAARRGGSPELASQALPRAPKRRRAAATPSQAAQRRSPCTDPSPPTSLPVQAKPRTRSRRPQPR